MESKIAAAIAYVRDHTGHGTDNTTIKNDAANIYASSYDEYMAIWKAIKNV